MESDKIIMSSNDYPRFYKQANISEMLGINSTYENVKEINIRDSNDFFKRELKKGDLEEELKTNEDYDILRQREIVICHNALLYLTGWRQFATKITRGLYSINEKRRSKFMGFLKESFLYSDVKPYQKPTIKSFRDYRGPKMDRTMWVIYHYNGKELNKLLAPDQFTTSLIAEKILELEGREADKRV